MPAQIQLQKQPFRKLPDGQEALLYTLTNANGLSVKITEFGATIVAINTPDAAGQIDDILLGYDNLDGYLNDQVYFGVTAGRYANRIKDANFSINSKNCQLARNHGKNHLHGGNKGFNKRLFKSEPFTDNDSAGVKLSYLSPAGEENYPGNLVTTVVCSVNNQNQLTADFYAATDQTTIVNLTHHCYFNLLGPDKADILDHELQINADHFTTIDDELIPTGEIRPVKDSPLDFTKPAKIGKRINEDCDQLKFAKGYDHNFVLNGKAGELKHAATLHEPNTGRVMQIQSTEPGIQFYSGNFLDGTIKGKHKRPYQHRTGLCLELQHFPDSPNHPNFPTTILTPGQTYRQTTIYTFSTR